MSHSNEPRGKPSGQNKEDKHAAAASPGDARWPMATLRTGKFGFTEAAYVSGPRLPPERMEHDRDIDSGGPTNYGSRGSDDAGDPFDADRWLEGIDEYDPERRHRQDRFVLGSVQAALLHDPYLDTRDMHVTVHAGSVSLTGTVSNRWMRLRAEDLVADCRGVERIDNRLLVTAPDDRPH